MLHAALDNFKNWYINLIDHGGYGTVAFLMILESTVFPIPSEVIIPVAAHLAHTRGNMSVAGVVIAGVLGSWFGATIMYWAARWAGRPLVLRYGRLVFISSEKVEAVERWMKQFGSFGVFFSRLLPVVRHLIGIPAGIARMSFVLYSVYTLLGSATWCVILAWLGIKAGEDTALMKGEIHQITFWVAGGFLVLGSLYYFFVHRQMRTKAPEQK